jgi:hypothetical protein
MTGLASCSTDAGEMHMYCKLVALLSEADQGLLTTRDPSPEKPNSFKFHLAIEHKVDT